MIQCAVAYAGEHATTVPAVEVALHQCAQEPNPHFAVPRGARTLLPFVARAIVAPFGQSFDKACHSEVPGADLCGPLEMSKFAPNGQCARGGGVGGVGVGGGVFLTLRMLVHSLPRYLHASFPKDLTLKTA